MDEFKRLAVEAPSELHHLGVSYLMTDFLPRLRVLERSRDETEIRLAAQACRTVGVLHYLHDAPIASERCHRWVLRLLRSLGDTHELAAEAWLEIADCLAQQGRLAAARRAVRRAAKLGYEPFHAPENVSGYVEGDACWEAAELLAHGQGRVAVNRLRGLRKVNARKWRACAWGLLGNSERYLLEWDQIASQTTEDFELTFSDWFYRPALVKDDPRYWRLLLSINHRLIPNVFEYHDSMHQWLSGMDMNSPDYLEWDRERRALICTYNIHRCSNDTAGLRTLLQRHPGWTEVADELS